MSDRDAFDTLCSELNDIERRILPFNTFEALGMQRREAQHSTFLAFLLDPHGNHGLGDAFLRPFLQQVAAVESDAPFLQRTDLSSWDYDHVIVKCEWQYVDILLLDPSNRFAIIIENKIDSSQHSNQLERYYNLVRRLHPSSRWRYVGGIYLTPMGEASKHPAYRPVSYSIVCKSLGFVLQERMPQPDNDNDIATALKQYDAMLRRHIVSDEKLAQDCRDIYRKHKRAIDLINRYRIDQKEQLRPLLLGLIKQADSPLSYNYEPPNKGSIMVTVKQWDHIPALHPRNDKWVLVLSFVFVTDGIDVVIQLANQGGDIRKKVLALAQANQDTFHQTVPKAADWVSLYRAPIFHLTPYQEASEDELAMALKEQWDQFIGGDFQKISGLITGQSWLQSSDASNFSTSVQAE